MLRAAVGAGLRFAFRERVSRHHTTGALCQAQCLEQWFGKERGFVGDNAPGNALLRQCVEHGVAAREQRRVLGKALAIHRQKAFAQCFESIALRNLRKRLFEHSG